MLTRRKERTMRLIDADALIKKMVERKRPMVGEDASKDRFRYVQWLADYYAIKEAPTVQQEPLVQVSEVTYSDRKRGEWIVNERGFYVCKNCGYMPTSDGYTYYNFCPNCGADMRRDK